MSALVAPVTARCSRCEKPVVVTGLITAGADPTRERLYTMLDGLLKNILCPECQGRLRYQNQVMAELRQTFRGRP